MRERRRGSGHRHDLLRRAAHAWRHAMRPTDLLARFGGDEFAVLLRNTGLSDARAALGRLAEATPAPVTVSLGIAEWDRVEPVDEALHRADRALYGAKAARRLTP